ncbi:MAG: hypothetical protein H7257_10285 [Taibaiella sp.]|nr:hypothetical protein [Taibaiella sp.]
MKQFLGLLGVACAIYGVYQFETCSSGCKNHENSYSNSNSISNENRQDRQTVSSPQNPSHTEAYTISTNFVKDNIVSPTTADFPFEPINVKNINNKYIVCSYLDAQNEYGAKIRQEYICLLDYNGGGWSRQSNWTLLALTIGDDIAYISKDKSQEEIATDINNLRNSGH